MAVDILIIEDDNFLSELLTRKLSGSAFNVFSAKDGSTGLRMLEKSQPAIVLLDLMLPIKNGFDVLEAMHTNPLLKHIPVIVFSNISDNTSIERATSLGARAYLIKSNSTLDELIQKITEVVSGHNGANTFFKNLTS